MVRAAACRLIECVCLAKWELRYAADVGHRRSRVGHRRTSGGWRARCRPVREESGASADGAPRPVAETKRPPLRAARAKPTKTQYLVRLRSRRDIIRQSALW